MLGKGTKRIINEETSRAHKKAFNWTGTYASAVLTVFSLQVAGLQSIKVGFGSKELTGSLRRYIENSPSHKKMEKAVQKAYRIADGHFNRTAKEHRFKTGEVLSPNNFFKNQSFVDKIFAAQHIADIAKAIKGIF